MQFHNAHDYFVKFIECKKYPILVYFLTDHTTKSV